MQISDAKIIITGAGSGFGRAMALCFSALGAAVSALDRNLLSLQRLQTEAPGIVVYECDVALNHQVEETVEKIFEREAKTNVLINNAGIMKNAPLVNLLQRPDSRHPIELWQQVIDVNQTAVFYMARAVAARMIKNRTKGAIINISSIAARGNAGQTAYAASKAAVEAMTKVWAKELGVFGIRSMGVAPGFIDTAGTREALEEKMLAQWIEKTPLRRTGTVDEVVQTVRFAIENDFLNGEIIPVNGGLSI